MKIQAVSIFLFMAIIFIGSATMVIKGALEGETNLDIMADTFFPCTPITVPLTDRMAVLRIDDIQAHAWSDISIRMVEDAITREIPPVLGVIPKNFKSDAELYQFLRERRCLVEFALHGWDHDVGSDGVTPEFRGMEKEEAFSRISRGKEVVETLSRRDVVTFIPPNNEQSSGTDAALQEIGIPLVSKTTEGYLDFHTATYDYQRDVLVSAESIVEDCFARYEESDLCVIMLHPQDFAAENGELDPRKYEIYTSLLDMLSARGVGFVRFEDLYREDHVR